MILSLRPLMTRPSSLLVLLPLLLFCRSAEAARIVVSSADCGTPPLLGLSFEVLPDLTLTGGTTACPDVAVGSLVDDDGGTTPLYGDITSITFSFTNPEQLIDNELEVGEVSELGTLTFDASSIFTLSGGPIVIFCEDVQTAVIPCTPQDVFISVEGFQPGTQFKVIAVNGIQVPEPVSLGLLGMGLAAVALRRRRLTR